MELIISNVSKTYENGVQALKNISLTINEGMFGLLGPNGAGKSTLMRTIATLQDPDEGTITFDGINVVENNLALRAQLGYLPQEFGVPSHVTAENFLDHIAALKGITNLKERRDTVAYLLNHTNLYHARSKKLDTFSGGMKQRFGIAQALIGNPKLIIVDEPTAGLDPEERNRFHNLLSEIGEQIIVILSTHIVDDVSDLCQRMAIINKGELLLVDEPLNAMKQLHGNVWRKLVAKQERESYRDSYKIISETLFAGKVYVTIFNEKDPGNGFTAVEPTLEDVYFSHIHETVGVTSHV